MELNKIYNIDCMVGLKQLENESVDMVITDPPYEVDYTKKVLRLQEFRHASMKNFESSVDTDCAIDFNELYREIWRVMKKDSHFYLWLTEAQLMKYGLFLQEIGFKLQLLVWVKNNGTLDITFGHKYMYRHEICLFMQKGWKKLNKFEDSIFISEIKDLSSYEHMTQKPVDIFKKMVLQSSKEGDIVLDCFMGSGTTAVACQNTNRRFIGFEVNENIYNKSISRLYSAKSQHYLTSYLQ